MNVRYISGKNCRLLQHISSSIRKSYFSIYTTLPHFHNNFTHYTCLAACDRIVCFIHSCIFLLALSPFRCMDSYMFTESSIRSGLFFIFIPFLLLFDRKQKYQKTKRKENKNNKSTRGEKLKAQSKARKTSWIGWNVCIIQKQNAFTESNAIMIVSFFFYRTVAAGVVVVFFHILLSFF